jgi:hypothetical protein
VVAKQTGPGEITVTWRAVPGAKGYTIGRSVWPNGFQRFRPNYPAETSLIDRDITPGVTHTYSVRALLANSRVSAAANSEALTPTEGTSVPDSGPVPGGGTGTPGSGGTGTPTTGGGTTGGTGTAGGTGGTGTGTTGAVAPEKGRFRVPIAGFKVLQETFDNPTQVDGQRDEVCF